MARPGRPDAKALAADAIGPKTSPKRRPQGITAQTVQPGGGVLTAFLEHPTHIFVAGLVLRLILYTHGLVQDAYSPVPYTDIDYFVFTDAARYVYRGLATLYSSFSSSSFSSASGLGNIPDFGTAEYSPYTRATYRYTPLLAWMLVPTAFTVQSSPLTTVLLFSFGKVLFAAADLVVGYLIIRICRACCCSTDSDSDSRPARRRANALAAIWLLNPMVATISTRGSAEAVLAVLVVGSVAAVMAGRHIAAGVLFGLSVHLKIYPIIYLPSIVVWLAMTSGQRPSSNENAPIGLASRLVKLVGTIITAPPSSLCRFLFSFVVTSTSLNGLMYRIYGFDFLYHTYLYHLIRIDHRHNFSVYNTVLHLSHAGGAGAGAGASAAATGLLGKFESLAFVPQLIVCAVAIPLALFLAHDVKRDRLIPPDSGNDRQSEAKRGVKAKTTTNPGSTIVTGRAQLPPLLFPAVLFLQTFGFVAFNKVCTSQYFLWYICLLPFLIAGSLPGLGSTSTSAPASASATAIGTGLAGWMAGQAVWLNYAYRLEFLGISTFVPYLWVATIAFFAVNVAILIWLIGLVSRWR